MVAGRPRSFDELDVLERAMEIFWQRGYEAVGMADLCQAMGLSRQSLYGAFGNKRGLFIRCVEHYRTTRLSQALALLEREEASLLDRVRSVVGFFETLALDTRCRGCFVANTLVEMGPHDPEIERLLAETIELLRGSIETTLREARASGELAPGKDPVRLSYALMNAIFGLAVTGKLQLPDAAVHEIYAGTLSILD
ncbi:MAG: TetR/AcrR family transcriptional regulator [Myxococcales bacterium]|nr:TetR/AcrR family transcriptional regulator [Myxococcales bacterium]